MRRLRQGTRRGLAPMAATEEAFMRVLTDAPAAIHEAPGDLVFDGLQLASAEGR